MKRPHLVHFLAIKTSDFICIVASITKREDSLTPRGELEKLTPSNPMQNFRLLNAHEFSMMVVGLDQHHHEIFNKIYESDSFGNFRIKIPIIEDSGDIQAFQLYEISTHPGLELNLGTFIPLVIEDPRKIIICDFDKTLVDTRYSTTRDVFNSLTKPLEYFPTIPNSVNILSSYIQKKFHPFILSASPHFYEDAIRDWLYKNKIYTAGIFLKDYRKVFSLFEGDLTTKDLKVQGLYKLNHLLDIILMTGIPDKLVMMGDNFESDPLIYLTFAIVLQGESDPWTVWNKVKELESFRLNPKQNSQFLNKLYQIKSMITQREEQRIGKMGGVEGTDSGIRARPEIEIYIRKRGVDDRPKKVPKFFAEHGHLIHLYEGGIQEDNNQENSNEGANNST